MLGIKGEIFMVKRTFKRHKFQIIICGIYFITFIIGEIFARYEFNLLPDGVFYSIELINMAAYITTIVATIIIIVKSIKDISLSYESKLINTFIAVTVYCSTYIPSIICYDIWPL